MHLSFCWVGGGSGGGSCKTPCTIHSHITHFSEVIRFCSSPLVRSFIKVMRSSVDVCSVSFVPSSVCTLIMTSPRQIHSRVSIPGLLAFPNYSLQYHGFSFSWLFQQTGMRSHDMTVGFPHSPAFAQITLSSLKLYLSLRQVHCFCALGNDSILQLFNILYASRKCLYSTLITNKFSCFLCLRGYFMFSLLGISYKVLGT
jgi:hypothetical protein